MKLTVARGQRPYEMPRSAVLVGGLLIVLGIAAAALPGIEQGPVACPFRAVTGLPCPTCGLTRATHWLMRGDVARAFAVNPFDTAFLLVVVPAFIGMWVANRTGGFAVRMSMSRSERRVAWTAIAAVAAANWAYVLATQS